MTEEQYRKIIENRTEDFKYIVMFSNVWTIHYYFAGDVGAFFRPLVNSKAIPVLRANGYTLAELRNRSDTGAMLDDVTTIIESGNHTSRLPKEVFSVVYDENRKQKRINYSEVIDTLLADGFLLKFGPFVGKKGHPRIIYTLTEPFLLDLFNDTDRKRKVLRASPALFTKRQRRLIHKFWPEADLTIVPEDII